MKIRHNPNPGWVRPSAQLSQSYENEVRRSTEKLERQHAAAMRRLEQAENRLARARRKPGAKSRARQLMEMEAVVELRRAELERYRRLMVAVPASAEHRGTKSFRPIGLGGSS
jgi:hypothetical protein